VTRYAAVPAAAAQGRSVAERGDCGDGADEAKCSVESTRR